MNKRILLLIEALAVAALVSLYFKQHLPQGPSAQNGVLDLTERDFQRDPIMPLNGEWLFYPGQVYSGQDLDDSIARKIPVPGYWSSAQFPGNSQFGTAVYRLTLYLPAHPGGFALKLRNITPNHDLWINGKLVNSAGVVSSFPEISRSGNEISLLPLDGRGGKAVLNISISNFHNISAGINHEILLGDFQALYSLNNRFILLDALALGAILIICVYSLTLYFLDNSRRDSMILGILCFLSFLFSGLKSELVLVQLFPFLQGEFRSKLIFLCLNNFGGLIYFYFFFLCPSSISRFLKKYFILSMTVSSLFVILTPMKIHSLFVLPMEILSLGSVAILFFSMMMRTKGRLFWDYSISFIFILALFFGVLACVLNDTALVSFQFVSNIFLAVILSIVFIQAWEFSKNIGQMEALEDSHEELTRINQELLAISQLDSLTGIANRRRFDQQLLALWEADRYMEKNVGLIMIDIDYFKNYNDFYGHQKGDSCLVKVASGLRGGLLRQNDFLARYGGEEFAVILSDMDADGVLRVAENLQKSILGLGIPHEASPCCGLVSISLGCSVLSAGEDCSLTELISQADQALYHAKHQGRNQVFMYTEEREEENRVSVIS